MTETATTPAPNNCNKSCGKKLVIFIAIVFGLLAIDHYTLHYVTGSVKPFADSTNIVSVPLVVDSVKAVPTITTPSVVVKDTAK